MTESVRGDPEGEAESSHPTTAESGQAGLEGTSVDDARAEQDHEQAVEGYRQLLQENDFLAQENRMFENYLRRVYPNMQIDLAPRADAKKKGKAGKPRGESKQDGFTPLGAEEKANICSHEIDAVLTEVARVEEEGQEEISEVKTLLEEVDMRIEETKKGTHDFKREIIIAAENPKTGKTSSEKFIKFMEDRLRNSDTSIEKLKLKNRSLKAQREKLKQRVQQKEAMSDMLHVVDFDQLKIENQQYLERIEEKNAELLSVKVTTGRTVQALNSIKEELNKLTIEHERLTKEKQERISQETTFHAEYATTSKDRDKCKVTMRRLKLEQTDGDQPQILDYVRMKHEIMELESKKSDLVRKCAILDMDAARTARLLKTIANSTGTPTA